MQPSTPADGLASSHFHSGASDSQIFDEVVFPRGAAIFFAMCLSIVPEPNAAFFSALVSCSGSACDILPDDLVVDVVR